MTKYGNLIEKARNQSSGQTENQAAKKPVNQKDGKPENQKTRKPETKEITEKSVNLSIKVPADLRRHWVSEAKKEGTTITAEITAALNKRFGTP